MSMNPTDHRGILVFVEQRGGVLHDVGLELLGKARALADRTGADVTAVLLGDRIHERAHMLIAHGADRVLIGDRPELEPYRLMIYTHVLADIIQEHKPDIVLVGATALGLEMAPRVAARLRTGLSAHCIDLDVSDDGLLLQMVPGWGGNVIATITCPVCRPQIATIMPGVMQKDYQSTREGTVREIDIALPENPGPEILEVIQEDIGGGVALDKAEIVVAGGWGVGKKENWSKVETLAKILGGAVGATRPPVDEGWAEEIQMIGGSGKTVRPRLYIGLGISGMMAHVAGMDHSEYVVAINLDPKAPIFENCDLGLVADLNEVLNPLIEHLKTRKS